MNFPTSSLVFVFWLLASTETSISFLWTSYQNSISILLNPIPSGTAGGRADEQGKPTGIHSWARQNSYLCTESLVSTTRRGLEHEMQKKK